MRIAQYVAVFGLCLLVGACVVEKGDLDIDIGDYENQLAAWNSQNMLDYQIDITLMVHAGKHSALITIKNEIPDSNYFPEQSTIPEFYSYIKELEKYAKDLHASDNSSCSLKASYDTEYHYPHSIILKTDYSKEEWVIFLMPLEEGDLDIDIGDYENQLAAWNSQNMLDYHIEGWYHTGDFKHGSRYIGVDYHVINGNPEKGSAVLRNMGTIPKIYAFIKEEEERIRNEYNGINRSYLNIQYDAEYHYPVKITSGVGHLFGRYWQWEINLKE